jgi:hypothetical protein
MLAVIEAIDGRDRVCPDLMMSRASDPERAA